MIFMNIIEPNIIPVLFIVSIGLAVGSLEDYVKSDIFHNNGILSWEILRHLNPSILYSSFWKLIGWFQNPRIIRMVFLTRMSISIGIIIYTTIGYNNSLSLFFMVLFLFITHLLISFRGIYGLDGAHQMSLIILLATICFLLSSPGSFAKSFCILFIGAQIVTSYVVSGIYKLKGEKWRKGAAMPGIMSAYIYGHPWLGAFLQSNPVLSKIMCWMVIFFEISFIFVLLAPFKVVLVYLGCGLLFHLANSFFMGLNGFFFSFVATYPCVMYLNYYLREVVLGFGS